MNILEIKTIPIILEKTPTKKFVVIGPGPIAKKILRLKNKFGERLEYIKSLPRADAISYLAKSFYSYTPTTDNGVGFIGDCWGAKTPLIATHSAGEFLEDRKDTLISKDVKSIYEVINELYDNDKLYDSLVEGGYKRYLRDHTAEAVGKQYLRIFEEAMQRWHER